MQRFFTTRFTRVLLIIVALVPSIIYIYCYESLPDEVPMHYDANGNITRYGDKSEILLIPLINILMLIIWIFLEYSSIRRKVSETKAEVEKQARNFLLAGILLQILYSIINYYFLYRAISSCDEKNVKFSMSILFTVIFGLMSIIIGNLLIGKIGVFNSAVFTIYGILIVLFSLIIPDLLLPIDVLMSLIVILLVIGQKVLKVSQ